MYSNNNCRIDILKNTLGITKYLIHMYHYITNRLPIVFIYILIYLIVTEIRYGVDILRESVI